jgi:hypothetical protein
MIRQTDNGRELVAKVIEELLKVWKDCKIVHGSTRHPQSQGSVERANADVETMVTQWLEDKKVRTGAGASSLLHTRKTTDTMKVSSKYHKC